MNSPDIAADAERRKPRPMARHPSLRLICAGMALYALGRRP
jgi:hypothetical protein